MDETYIGHLIDQLKAKGVIFETGLSNVELREIEQRDNFRFPPDLQAFLERALPIWWNLTNTVGTRLVIPFPNWRAESASIMIKAQADLLNGIRIHVEQADYWLSQWGDKPQTLSQSLKIFRQKFMEAPILIPVFAHRFIPSQPEIAGNPVISVAGVDIIHYGNDLPHYFHAEFGVERPVQNTLHPRPIMFWDDIIYGDTRNISDC